MSMTDLPFLEAIRSKMQWHQSRQTLLTKNVANVDTPGYRPVDLKSLDFTDELHKAMAPPVGMVATHSNHIAGKQETGKQFDVKKNDFEVTPDGNGVSVEEQMMKVTANQMDYQAATSLYAKSLGILRTAIGRRG